MKIWAAEIFIQHLPESVRTRLLSGAAGLQPVFGNKRRGFDEVFLLVTDNQFVVYGVGESVDPMLNLFFQDPVLYEHVHFYKSPEASINHLFATATGLCSDLKGVRRVSDSICQAHRHALACGGMGLILDNLVRQSMRVSGKVRKTTGIENLGQILVDAGMDIVFNQMDNPLELSYLVLGSGDIARCALEFFHHEGFRKVVVASRDEAASKKLAESFSVNYIDQDQIEIFIQLSDVVITEDAVHALSAPFVKEDGLERKIFLDFGNTFSGAQLKQHPLCSYYTIEDINNLPAANANVFHSLEEAWQMVEVEARLAIEALNDLQQVPVLRECWGNISAKLGTGILPQQRGRLDKGKVSLIHFFNNALLRRRDNISTTLQRCYDIQISNQRQATENPDLSKKLRDASCRHLN
jgi:glutamyl-tRNA reductase